MMYFSRTPEDENPLQITFCFIFIFEFKFREVTGKLESLNVDAAKTKMIATSKK